MTRFECDYTNCNRVLYKDKERSFRCTSCGHGTMRAVYPKAYCCNATCKTPIYDNVDPTRDIICAHCTMRLVMGVKDSVLKVHAKIRPPKADISKDKILKKIER